MKQCNMYPKYLDWATLIKCIWNISIQSAGVFEMENFFEIFSQLTILTVESRMRPSRCGLGILQTSWIGTLNRFYLKFDERVSVAISRIWGRHPGKMKSCWTMAWLNKQWHLLTTFWDRNKRQRIVTFFFGIKAFNFTLWERGRGE